MIRHRFSYNGLACVARLNYVTRLNYITRSYNEDVNALIHRSNDRIHRNHYNDLVHKRDRYGGGISLEQSLKGLIVMMKEYDLQSTWSNKEKPLNSKKPLREKVLRASAVEQTSKLRAAGILGRSVTAPSATLKSSILPKNGRLLELVIFNILVEMVKLDGVDLSKYSEDQEKYLIGTLKGLGVDPGKLEEEMTRLGIDLTEYEKWGVIAESGIYGTSGINATANTVNQHSVSSESTSRNATQRSEISKLAIATYLIISNLNLSTLTIWLKSITAPSVAAACESLTNQTNIPPFVVVDIIQRTPTSKFEFGLQLDLWFEYLPAISETYFNKASEIKMSINNLLYYSVKYHPEAVQQVLNTLQMLITNKSRKFTFINIDYINDLIWNLSRFNLLQGHPNIKGHEILVLLLNKLNTTKDKTHQLLTLRSNMGLVLMLGPKGKRLADSAEKHFFNGEALTNMDLVAYNAAKISLAESPEQLLEAFNHSHKFSDSSLLWLVFVRKLEEFDLLNEIRVIKVTKEILKHDVLTPSILKCLLKPFKGMRKLGLFLDVLPQSIIKQHEVTILPVYISMLYKNHNSSTLRETYYPWDDEIRLNLKLESSQYKGFPSVQEYARCLYKNISSKTVNDISVMLQGEAITDPQNVHELYKSELGDDLPNEGCVLALVRASMRNISGECILWGNLYAPQVAIHEFKKNVKTKSYDGIVLRNATWQQYIQMLKKYEYIAELSELVRWWEEIKFAPLRKTLLLLLSALPEEYSKRYIKHYGGQGQLWKWPSQEDFDKWQRERDI